MYRTRLKLKSDFRSKHYSDVNECHGVSNHRHFDCLFNRWFIITSLKTSKPVLLAFAKENHWGRMDSPHKGPVTRKAYVFMLMALLRHSVIRPFPCLLDDYTDTNIFDWKFIWTDGMHWATKFEIGTTNGWILPTAIIKYADHISAGYRWGAGHNEGLVKVMINGPWLDLNKNATLRWRHNGRSSVSNH